MSLRIPALAGLVLALLSCAQQHRAEEPAVFPIASPVRSAASFEREYVGEVQAIQRAELRSRIKGRIEAVLVDEGQTVEAGQRLFSIGAKGLQQELRRARAATASAAAELKAAQLERANTKMLFEKSVVSAAEMALLESKVQSLAAKLEEARADEGQAAINLTYAEVRAPFAGVVNRFPRKVGSLVDEGELLTTLTNTSEVFVYFRVSEREYLEYTSAKSGGNGKEVSFKLANGDTLPARGVMDAVESEFDRNTGTIAFRARFPNEGQLLKHGSSGKVVVRTEVEDAVTIPQKSTFEVQDHVYVYVVDPDGKARARRITPRLRLKDSFVVESGITPAERFIAEGIQKVKDGDAVAVRPASPSASRL